MHSSAEVANLQRRLSECIISRGHRQAAEHLGAAVARAQHVQALDVAVHDSYKRVVQIGESACSFARCSDALVCRRGRVIAQSIEPAAAVHPLHDDEGVGRFQAGAEYLDAVRVVHLRGLSAAAKQRRAEVSGLPCTWSSLPA